MTDIEQQLAKLPKEIDPDTDLWPGVLSAISNQTSKTPRHLSDWKWSLPFATAAALALFIASQFVHFEEPQQAYPDSHHVAMTFLHVSQPLPGLVPAQKQLTTMSRESRKYWLAEFRLINQVALQLHKAMIQQPNHPLLTQQWLDLNLKKAILLQKFTEQTFS